LAEAVSILANASPVEKEKLELLELKAEAEGKLFI
jgi:hypothetical protein